MTTSMDRSNRTVRRAWSPCATRVRQRRFVAVPLALLLWGCDRPDTVEHEPDAIDSVAGEAAASTEYVFDAAAVRTLRGQVLAVQPFQRMRGTRYGVRLRIDVEGERVYAYLAPQGFLEDRGLVFELMAHPDQLVDAAAGLEGHPDLVVVVEHAGWPRNDGADERELWRLGIDALAGVGENVLCKLSGLAMPLHSMAADVLAPWVEYAIEAFGVDRCLFASNFPVDGLHGSFDQLYTAYADITAGLDDDARDKLFAANAERVYRLSEN